MFNPKQMQQLMKQLNIKQDNVDANRVVIELNDGRKIVINEPGVMKVNMQGKSFYQIEGEEKFVEELSEEDIKTVMEQANVSEEKAKEALKKNDGKVADAIMSLAEDE